MADQSARLAILGGVPTVPAGSHNDWPEVSPHDRTLVGNAVSPTASSLFGAEALELARSIGTLTGTRHCVLVNSGTAACHAALVGAGVGPGDEVIVPALSFVATAMAVLLAGAHPVFCDIDPRTFLLDLPTAESKITTRTRALFFVHTHGLVGDMDAARALTDRRRIALVEDAAQAVGARFHGRPAGSFGRSAALSFNRAKPLQAIDGGAAVSNAAEVYQAMCLLSCFGEEREPLAADESRSYWSRWLGQNYRLHPFAAAFALGQVQRLAGYLERARRNAAILSAGLRSIPGLLPPVVPVGHESTYCYFRVLLDPAAYGWRGTSRGFRDRIISALQHEGVAVGTWQLYPLPALPVFRRANPEPWRPGLQSGPLTPWTPDTYPVTSHILDNSLIVGSSSHPLHVQPSHVMHLYVEAFRRVFAQIDAATGVEDVSLKVRPPIPQEDLA